MVVPEPEESMAPRRPLKRGSRVRHPTLGPGVIQPALIDAFDGVPDAALFVAGLTGRRELLVEIEVDAIVLAVDVDRERISLGIKQLDGFMAERWRIEPEYAVRVDPGLGVLGVLLEPTTVVAKAWEHIERIGRRAQRIAGDRCRRRISSGVPLMMRRGFARSSA